MKNKIIPIEDIIIKDVMKKYNIYWNIEIAKFVSENECDFEDVMLVKNPSEDNVFISVRNYREFNLNTQYNKILIRKNINIDTFSKADIKYDITKIIIPKFKEYWNSRIKYFVDKNNIDIKDIILVRNENQSVYLNKYNEADFEINRNYYLLSLKNSLKIEKIEDNNFFVNDIKEK